MGILSSIIRRCGKLEQSKCTDIKDTVSYKWAKMEIDMDHINLYCQSKMPFSSYIAGIYKRETFDLEDDADITIELYERDGLLCPIVGNLYYLNGKYYDMKNDSIRYNTNYLRKDTKVLMISQESETSYRVTTYIYDVSSSIITIEEGHLHEVLSKYISDGWIPNPISGWKTE